MLSAAYCDQTLWVPLQQVIILYECLLLSLGQCYQIISIPKSSYQAASAAVKNVLITKKE